MTFACFLAARVAYVSAYVDADASYLLSRALFSNSPRVRVRERRLKRAVNERFSSFFISRRRHDRADARDPAVTAASCLVIARWQVR